MIPRFLCLCALCNVAGRRVYVYRLSILVNMISVTQKQTEILEIWLKYSLRHEVTVTPDMSDVSEREISRTVKGDFFIYGTNVW